MSMPKTRTQEKLAELNKLLDYYQYPTKTETLCAQKGLLLGWMSRLAATDWIVAEELERRLEKARQENKD
jgi:hypothetical protein